MIHVLLGPSLFTGGCVSFTVVLLFLIPFPFEIFEEAGLLGRFFGGRNGLISMDVNGGMVAGVFIN